MAIMGFSIPIFGGNGTSGSPFTYSDSSDGLYDDAILTKYRGGRHFVGSGCRAANDETQVRQRSMLAQLVGGIYPERASEIADDLLERFGSLGGIFSAARLPSFVAICGEPLAEMFLSAKATVMESLKESVERSRFDPNDPVVLRYIAALMKDCPEEQLHAFYLDARNGFLHHEQVAAGSWSAISVGLRPVLRRAIEIDSSKLVLVHNHPSGDPRPSRADMDFTQHVAKLVGDLGIRLLDHLIVAGPNIFSMRIAGMMS
jgi:DNA repair protein RadC